MNFSTTVGLLMTQSCKNVRSPTIYWYQLRRIIVQFSADMQCRVATWPCVRRKLFPAPLILHCPFAGCFFLGLFCSGLRPAAKLRLPRNCRCAHGHKHGVAGLLTDMNIHVYEVYWIYRYVLHREPKSTLTIFCAEKMFVKFRLRATRNDVTNCTDWLRI